MKENIPKNLERMSYEEIHEYVKSHYSLKAPFDKVKFNLKYDTTTATWKEWHEIGTGVLKEYHNITDLLIDWLL